MLFKNLSIQKKLMFGTVLLSTGMLLITCSLFFTYEFYTFRETTIEKLSALGNVIAVNSTAALAFDDRKDAKDILAALKAEPHITAACLYDKNDQLFTYYPSDLDARIFPVKPAPAGYHFHNSYLTGYEPVIQGTKKWGTLYMKSDLGEMFKRFRQFAVVTLFAIGLSFFLAYLLSKMLQKSIAQPILGLAETAKIISTKHDYSVRGNKLSEDEVGLLTDAFNFMLMRIQEQNKTLGEFNQRLEEKIKERTKDMEIANKELESFTYSVSHDLRAPLRAIHGYSRILETDYIEKLDGDGKKIIGVILRNSKHMGELIDDLLAFSKLGKQEINSKNIHMETLARMVADEFLSPATGDRLKILIHPLPSAWGDPVLIKQVWINIVSNAIKYSGKKTKAIIEIGCYRNQNHPVYFVKDNGEGFDMQYYDKLFGVFQRLHSYEEFEGTGVGLAIAQRIILKHHGRIWAESRLNEGAVFYFSLLPGSEENKPS
jgi:signal transduction histidine kinase